MISSSSADDNEPAASNPPCIRFRADSLRGCKGCRASRLGRSANNRPSWSETGSPTVDVSSQAMRKSCSWVEGKYRLMSAPLRSLGLGRSGRGSAFGVRGGIRTSTISLKPCSSVPLLSLRAMSTLLAVFILARTGLKTCSSCGWGVLGKEATHRPGSLTMFCVDWDPTMGSECLSGSESDSAEDAITPDEVAWNGTSPSRSRTSASSQGKESASSSMDPPLLRFGLAQLQPGFLIPQLDGDKGPTYGSNDGPFTLGFSNESPQLEASPPYNFLHSASNRCMTSPSSANRTSSFSGDTLGS